MTTAAAGRARRAMLLVTVLVALLAGNTAGVATAAPDDSVDRMVRLPDGDIHVVTNGAPSPRAVVLIHGTGGSVSWWDPVLPALADLYVVRVDLLGHGRSAKPDSGYGMAEQGHRVAAVLDRLGVRHATVVGHSTGGYVATELAAQRRDLVNAIALIGTGSRLDAFADNGPLGNLLFVPQIGQPLWPLLPDAAIRYAMSSAFTRDVAIPQQLVDDFHGMTYRSLTATSDASDVYLRERQEPDRLADLGLPSLVLYGSGDHRWPAASFQDYRRVPDVRIESLDCGHSPMIEEPGPTGELLRDFADQH
ncbi:alpha/beta fold hydrolase [Nocardia africana]|uniref:Dihydrolipoyllysine-residue acetyltransferase component of acetoin cleaving system n=1 Tax=Nocardia africana TaxID=134964 RepID=A0A378X3X8_9NOCA|nr:alpha/beta hydrolase [Nocardia africana]MCC3317553.1 alpha/beta hydrolase [Nocardia africana]SUA48310.1 Dihydrolipoyllysine-residue acetyltransferase component of acetoin cleaving system [Nocardia africana]